MSTIRHRLIDMHRRGLTRRPASRFMVEEPWDSDTPRPAAVLIAVTERAESDGAGPGVLLIERPGNMRKHAGQVAFPGGAIDPGETAIEAALREANEEISLPLSHVHVIGEVDGYATRSGFSITPVLATVPPDLPLRANPAEVDVWFEAPLSFVLDPANHAEHDSVWRGKKLKYIDMEWDGHRIWGATGGILANLSRRLHWDGQSA